MVLGQSIVNDQGQLKLVGCGKPDPNNPYGTLPESVRAYDLASGAGNVLCDITETLMNPVVAAKDGTIFVYSASNRTAFYRVQGGEAVKLEEAVPDFYFAEEGEPVTGTFGNILRNQYLCVLAPVTDGFVLVGPPEAGGASDTYILRDGADKFEAYEKRSSDDRVYSQAGCTYRGRLFLIGAAWFEQEMRIFRATKMDVPEYPGDIPCEEKTDPSEEDDKPSKEENVKSAPDSGDEPSSDGGDKPSGRTDDQNPSGNKDKARDDTNTGDEAPIEIYLAVLAAAAAALGGGLLRRK